MNEPQILSGLKVLELGAGSTGSSLTGMLLADAGARVVKVEPPSGDRFRTAHESGFLVWNRGKESVVLDLREEAGAEQFRELARGADVVIDGLAPGRTDAWGVGFDALRAVNPGLVYTAITGFGPDGDYAAIKSYEAIVASKAGLYSRGMYGYREGPIYYPVPWGGFGAAMHATAGTLAALRVRDATGSGQRVDATMVAGLEPHDIYATPTWQLAVRRGEGAPADVLGVTGASRYAVMPCSRDGRFFQTPTMLPHQAQALTTVTGLAHLIEDPLFAGMPKFPDPETAQRWEDAICEAFRERDASYWIDALAANGDVAFEVAITSEEALDNPQFQHNGDVLTIDHPERGPIRQVGPIGHFADTPCVIERPAPALDAHDALWPAENPAAPTGADLPEFPLSDVTIVEFGAFYAMPYALAILASLGARVIKIEDANGDPARQAFGPEVLTFKTTPGKESISLDLRDPRSKQLVRDILATADAFVTGFRPGVAERLLGVGYDELRARNPKLVFVQATGYGADGPSAARPLYGPAASAIAGAYGRQVGYWSQPERNEGMSLMEIQAIIHPRLAIIQDGDPNAALGLSVAISLALHHQRATGRGQFLLTSMIASNAWAYGDDFCSYEGKRPVPLADEEYFGLDALHRVYQTAEGWVCIHVDQPDEWQQLALALGLDPSGEPDAKVLEQRFRTESASHWETRLVALGVPCAAVCDGGLPAFTSTNEVMRATGRTIEIDHPLYGTMVRAAPPVSFSRHDGRVGRHCLRGEHNDAVLEEFGIDEVARKQWVADGILFPPDPVNTIP